MRVIIEQAQKSHDILKAIANKHDRYIEHMILSIYATDLEYSRNINHWLNEITNFTICNTKEKSTNRYPKIDGQTNCLHKFIKI